MPSEGVHITLDLEIDGDCISGRVDAGCGRPDYFHGWLALITVLDRLLEPRGLGDGSPDSLPQRPARI